MRPLAVASHGDAPLDAAALRHAATAASEHAANADQPADAIAAAVDALGEVLPGVHVGCFVIEHDRLWILASHGYTFVPEGIPVSTGIIGRGVRSGDFQLVHHVRNDPDFVSVGPGTIAQLVAPLTADDQVVGVLSIEADLPIGAGAEEALEPLVRALAPAVAALRGDRLLDVSALARLFVHLTSLREPIQVARTVTTSLRRVLPVECAHLFLRGDDGSRSVELASSHDATPELCLTPGAADALRRRIDSTSIVETLTVQGMRVPELIGRDVHAVALLPLRVGDRELGVLAGVSSRPIVLDHQQGELAALLAAHAAAALDAVLAIDRERTHALTDSLTGLLNRRGFESRLDGALPEAQAERRPLSLAVLDCDDFKQLNDRAGHAFGDAMLRALGTVLQRVLPSGATAARFGGDEFVLMLPSVDVDDAGPELEGVISRLRDGLDEEGFPTGLSAGVATYPYDGAGASQLLRAADQALYAAKDRGKGCVVSFREIAKRDGPSAAAKQTRQRGESTLVLEAAEAADALWRETSPDLVLERLGRSIAYVVGGAAVMISRLDGDLLTDYISHSLRDIDVAPTSAYLVSDFPVTARVLETRRSRAISFQDADLDPAEAFVMRDIGMSACILLPLVIDGVTWGLIEVYDARVRSYTPGEQAVADLLVLQAGRKLELLGGAPTASRPMPVWRPPGAPGRVF